jgi:hypothetical protein
MITFFVARPGFEPRQTVPKTVVLPLYYRAALFFKDGKSNTREKEFQINFEPMIEYHLGLDSDTIAVNPLLSNSSLLITNY